MDYGVQGGRQPSRSNWIMYRCLQVSDSGISSCKMSSEMLRKASLYLLTISEIRELCDKHNLIFIEDAAHSIGTKYDGRQVGSLADMTCRNVTEGLIVSPYDLLPSFHKPIQLF